MFKVPGAPFYCTTWFRVTGKGMVHLDSPSHTPARGLALLRRANRCRQGLTCPGVLARIQSGGSGMQGEEGLELNHGCPPISWQRPAGGSWSTGWVNGETALKAITAVERPPTQHAQEEEQLARQVSANAIKPSFTPRHAGQASRARACNTQGERGCHTDKERSLTGFQQAPTNRPE